MTLRRVNTPIFPFHLLWHRRPGFPTLPDDLYGRFSIKRMARKEFFRVPLALRLYLRLSARSRGPQALVFGKAPAQALWDGLQLP